jgi:hypothetical protein
MKIPVYILLICSTVWAQTSAPRTSVAPATASAPAASSNVAIPDASGLTQQMRVSAEKANADVGRLRIDKWKADAASKQQATALADSIRRNLNYAVPDLLQRMQASPSSLNANFRLYRNLNALFDTFSSLVESAGAFGAKEQYDPLAADLSDLDHLRRQMADRMDLLAGANDAELARPRSQAVSTASGAKSTSTKVVVNNDDAPKAKKKPKAATTSTTTPSK